MNNKDYDDTTIIKKSLTKFLFVVGIGIISFMIPLTINGQSGTIVSALTDLVSTLINPIANTLILSLTAISVLGSLYDYIYGRLNKSVNEKIHNIFAVNTLYLITKIIALIIVVMYIFEFGPSEIISPDNAGMMMGLGKTLVALAIALSYLLPFLTDGGLMEFVGVLTQKIVRPLFKVPSNASVDLIASWLGAANAAVILSAEKYRKGFYTKREVGVIMTNFSLVSVPFCMVIATTARVQEYFSWMYLLLAFTGLVAALITPRIYPLKSLKDEYLVSRKSLPVDSSEGNLLHRSLVQGCFVARDFKIRDVVAGGNKVLLTITISLLPIVIAWGCLGLLLVNETPVLQYLSLPMGYFLQFLGVSSAFEIAPTTLAGFIDMFIPVLLLPSSIAIKTRFIVATLSLAQIIYITEVGALVIQTDIGINLAKLFLIFLERTIIVLPLIVFAANLIFGM